MSTKSKLDWMKSLKVGDEVCDCRYKHLSIKEIECVTVPIGRNFLSKIIYHDWVPINTSFKLDTLWERFCDLLKLTYLVDKDLTLEDGGMCSAMHCCDPVDHRENHPSED